jgi:hypothetical protein
MEAIFIKLLMVSPDRLATIKRVVQKSNMLDTYKPRYEARLISIAKQHNLI